MNLTALLSGTDPDLVRFPKLGIELHINSTAFTLFGASVTWYGILITIGMMLAMVYAFRRMRSFGIDSDRAIDGVIGGVIGAIIGARAYYVIFHWDSYAGDWKSIFNIRQGGLAIYGGIIGALLIGSLVCKLRKVRLLPMYDLTAIGLLIGQCIGRWGNFTNQEAFGSNTDGIFGMTSGRIENWIKANISDGSVDAAFPVHPCFLYESAWCLLGFILLHIVSKKWRKFDGQIFLMYIVWYGAGRFFIEGLRTDSLYLGTVKVSQALALICVVTGIILLIIGFSRTKRLGTDYQLYVDTEESKALLAESDQREADWQEKHSKKKDADTEEATHTLLSEEDAEEVIAEKEDAPAVPVVPEEDDKLLRENEKAAKDAKVDALIEELKAEKEQADTPTDEA